MPQDALQALDIVLKEAVNLDMKFYNIGRQYFPLDGQTLDVGFGKEVWCGTFSQVRPFGWKDHGILITLNVDTAERSGVGAGQGRFVHPAGLRRHSETLLD